MNTYCFRLYFRDRDYMTEETAEALYAAGCDDCMSGSGSGRAYAHFGRDADSLEAAVASTAADARKAGCELDRVEIDQQDVWQLGPS